MLVLLPMDSLCASSKKCRNEKFVLRDYRSNGKECIVSMHGHCTQQTIPFKDTTIIVKHVGVNSRTGILNNPLFWRQKYNNEVTQQEVRVCSIPKCSGCY